VSLLNILTFPDPRLRTKAKPVAAVDSEIRTLVDDMLETMYDAPGIGLAANQVNVAKQVIVIDISEARDEPHRQRERQRPRHVGEAEALVHPGDAGAEGPEPEQPAEEEGAPWRRASTPREKQRGKGRERDGKEPERGERERQSGPGREASARGGGLPHASAPA